MSSDSEFSDSIDLSESMDESEDSTGEWGTINTELIPYQDKQLADVGNSGGKSDVEEETDADGLTQCRFLVSKVLVFKG